MKKRGLILGLKINNQVNLRFNSHLTLCPLIVTVTRQGWCQQVTSAHPCSFAGSWGLGASQHCWPSWKQLCTAQTLHITSQVLTCANTSRMTATYKQISIL